MREFNSVNDLTQEVLSAYSRINEDILILLIGGCSRAGKSMLAEALSQSLNERNQRSLRVNLDSWLIDVDKREMNSTVMERYDTEAIVNSIKELVEGKPILPPVYHPETRKRIAEYSNCSMSIDSGILIIEGVIALAIRKLINLSKFKVFVKISDCLRIKRLIEFYSQVKKVTRAEYKTIILSREHEEIEFIKKSAMNADVIFYWNK